MGNHTEALRVEVTGFGDGNAALEPHPHAKLGGPLLALQMQVFGARGRLTEAQKPLGSLQSELPPVVPYAGQAAMMQSTIRMV